MRTRDSNVELVRRLISEILNGSANRGTTDVDCAESGLPKMAINLNSMSFLENIAITDFMHHDVDHVNFLAIEILEAMGDDEPTEDDICFISMEIKAVFLEEEALSASSILTHKISGSEETSMVKHIQFKRRYEYLAIKSCAATGNFMPTQKEIDAEETIIRDFINQGVKESTMNTFIELVLQDERVSNRSLH